MRNIMHLLLFVFVIVVLFVGFKPGHKRKNVQGDSVTGASFYGPVLQWNSFLGGNKNDNSYSIAIDSSNNLYVCGWSESNWGRPVNPFGGGSDAFVAKLNSNGVLQWHTFLGGNRDDLGHYIVLDGTGNIYVTGNSESSWGSPVNPFGGGSDDAFVAKLNSNGVRQWHTFLGGIGSDSGMNIVMDGKGNIYVTGHSLDTWGSPVNPFGGGYNDTFVAKLKSSGVRQWHTFLGGNDIDFGSGIVLDGSDNIFLTGYSHGAWGTPVNPFGGGRDVFLAKLYPDGVRQWHTFLGEANGTSTTP